MCREVVRITSCHICLPPGNSASSSTLLIVPGWSELVTYEGTNCPSSRLPPNGTKPDHSGLTATADARGYCRVRASPRVLTSKIRDRPRSNILDKPLGGRKRGPDRVMELDWGFMESTHHTARTVGYSGESCTHRSNRFPRQVQIAAGAVLP